MGVIIECIFTFTNPKRCIKMLVSLKEKYSLEMFVKILRIGRSLFCSIKHPVRLGCVVLKAD